MKLSELCHGKLRMDVAYEGRGEEGWPEGSTRWKVRLHYKGRQLTVPFTTGPALPDPGTPAGVIECLLGDADAGAQTFYEFCKRLGYDENSRRAKRIYKACELMCSRLTRFLGEDFADFRDAERG